jgi:hypothetical protein
MSLSRWTCGVSVPRFRGTFLWIAIATLLVCGSAFAAFRDYRTWYSPRKLVNLHVREAGAWLQGRVALDAGGTDVAVVGGRMYNPFPPGPALLFLLPVALLGERLFLAPAICLGLSILNVFTLRMILRRLQVRPETVPWLLAAFFLGSGYWFTAVYSYGVWHSAHVVAVTALLLALCESLGRRRGWVMGACLGMAFLSRQFTLLNAPFLLVAATTNRANSDGPLPLRHLGGFAIAIVLSIAVCMGFNEVRFGSPLDTGYGYLQWEGYERARVEQYGLFSLAYMPINLYHLLMPGFHLGFSSVDLMSGVTVDWFGSSLPAASPFLFAAFLMRCRTWLVRTAWTVIAVIVLAHSCYFVNGAGQLNWQRYALDYWPVLFVLIALGVDQEARQRHSCVWKILIGYAITVNAFALVFVQAFAELLIRWPRWITGPLTTVQP